MKYGFGGEKVCVNEVEFQIWPPDLGVGRRWKNEDLEVDGS